MLRAYKPTSADELALDEGDLLFVTEATSTASLSGDGGANYCEAAKCGGGDGGSEEAVVAKRAGRLPLAFCECSKSNM